MAKIEITVPDVAQIIVTGPVHCGKSVMMARIEKVLREEFGANTVTPDLDIKRRIGSPGNPTNQEVRMVGETTWVLSEA